MKSAYEQGKILCGISAGAICWFNFGHSDSRSFRTKNNWEYIRVRGLGILKGFFCPHFNSNTKGIARAKDFKTMLTRFRTDGLAVDDHAAIVFENEGLYCVIQSREKSHAYEVQRIEDGIKKIKL